MSPRTASAPTAARAASAAQSVQIELSRAQVDQVVRAASGEGNMSVLLSGLQGARQTLEDNRRLIEDPRMSRSLLLGLLVLSGLPRDGSEIGVIDLAHNLGLGASTTYRYVATLLSVGLLERDPSTRRYRLAR
ncbi:MAG TPA: helix-turn-helix domain-containing protein [Solirubrobacteraceae bacterium]|nr:helix-turn-helix domain-containing protein [Solirubrobacteraceae bacterium]